MGSWLRHMQMRAVSALRKCPHSWSGRQLEAIADALCMAMALERGREWGSFLTIVRTAVTIRSVLLTPLFWQLCRHTHSVRLHCHRTVPTSASLRACIYQAAQGPSLLGLSSCHSCGPWPSPPASPLAGPARGNGERWPGEPTPGGGALDSP